MANEVITEPVVTETDKTALDPETAKIVNSAVTSQLKRLLPKAIADAVASLKPVEAVSDSAPKTEPVKEESTKEIQTLRRQIEALTASNKAATAKARSATLNSELTNALKGKVTEDWLDVAVEKLAAKAVFSESDEPSLKFGDDEFSIADGVAQWTKDPSSKRFLTAPKSNQTARAQTPQLNKFLPNAGTQNAQAMDPLSPEYENVMAEALNAQGGLLGNR